MSEISGAVAAFAALPPLAFSDEESRELAKRVREVQKHFPALPMPNPKYVALGALVLTAGKIGKNKLAAVAEYRATMAPGLGHNGGPAMAADDGAAGVNVAPGAPAAWFVPAAEHIN
jgi:hypothetical protein